MRGLGGFLFIAAIASAILPMMDRQLIVFMWIDNWGPGVGWALRGVIAIVGAVMFIKGEPAE